MATLTSRELIKQDVIGALAPRDEALAKLPVPLITTSAGSTTTLLDTKLGRGTTEVNKYDSRDIEIPMPTLSVGPAITIAFVDGGAGNDTITDSDNGLAGILAGATVSVSGSGLNDGEYLVTASAAGTLTLSPGVLTTEAAGASVTLRVVEIAAVDDGGFNGTSTLTFSPAASTLPPIATRYFLYPLGLSPELLNAAISDVLRETVAPHVHFPSLVADADLTLYSSYVAAVAAGAIATVSTPTTNEYVVTSSGVFMGERAIHIIADDADEGFETANFSVTDTESLVVSVFVWVNVGSMDVVLYNTTGSTTLKTVIPDEPAWTEVRFAIAAGSGVEQCKLQFLSNASGDDFYVSAPMIVQSTKERSYDMPPWLTYPGQVGGFRYLDTGPASGAGASPGDMFIPLGVKPRADHAPGSILDARGIHQVKLGGMIPADNRPVYLVAMRQFDDLITNAATTPADRQFMRDRVVARILDRWGDADARKWERRAKGRAEVLGYNPSTIRIEPNPPVTV
jgi:hypothetical protein